MKKQIKILLADPRALVRSGIRALLEKSTSMKIVAEAANSRDLLRLAGSSFLQRGSPSLTSLATAARIFFSLKRNRAAVGLT